MRLLSIFVSLRRNQTACNLPVVRFLQIRSLDCSDIAVTTGCFRKASDSASESFGTKRSVHGAAGDWTKDAEIARGYKPSKLSRSRARWSWRLDRGQQHNQRYRVKLRFDQLRAVFSFRRWCKQTRRWWNYGSICEITSPSVSYTGWKQSVFCEIRYTIDWHRWQLCTFLQQLEHR